MPRVVEPPLDVCRPAPGVRRFTVPLAMASPDHLHIHVLDTPDGELLIDCGARGSENALQTGLRSIDAHPQRVLITHAHVDHWGLATTLTERVLAHPAVLPSLRFASGAARPEHVNGWPAADELTKAFAGFRSLVAGVPEIQPITDGEQLGDWTVLWTPGHDPGHVCLYRDSDRVLLCGDLLLPGYTPNIQPGPDGSDALADFLASLERVASLDITLVLPAHGAAYTNAAERAQQLHAHHAARLDSLRTALRAGPSDIDELRDAAFGSNLSKSEDRMLAAMETYAHLEHLRRLGDANVDPDGQWTPAHANGSPR